MNKEPNKSKEPNNEEARVLSDEELEGIVGGGFLGVEAFATPADITADIKAEITRDEKMTKLAVPGFEIIADEMKYN